MPTHVLSIGCAHDPVLHRIGPLALAASVQAALLIDLDSAAAPYPGSYSLAELCSDGLQGLHLRPRQSGVAVLANGGVGREEASDVIRALIKAWPAVVLRESKPDVRIIPLIPGMPVPIPTRPAVYQPTGRLVSAPGPGVLLPVLGRSTASGLIRGAMPLRRRWISAWAEVWETRWA